MKGIRLSLVAAACMGIAACGARLPTVTPDQPHGLVISQTQQLADYTYPARVVAINGVPVPLEHRGPLYVAPGMHTFRLTPDIADREIRDVRRGRQRDDPDAYVDINIQPGMQYVVAARETGDHMSEWRAVVTRVEPIVPRDVIGKRVIK